jgi:putative hydrolase of the HAD superfamily
MSELPSTILFDLDDTILDDSGSVADCWQRACRHDIAPAMLETEVRRVAAWYWSDPDRHRTGRADLMAATSSIVAAALEHLGRPDRTAALTIARRYRALRDGAVVPIPGAFAALERLGGRGVRLGLITNGAAGPQRAKLARFDLERLFDYVGVEGELGYGKPDPRAYTTAIGNLGCDPATTWMVGDNLEWDVLAPQRLGIAGVWVNASSPPAEPAAEAPWRVVRSIAELI